VKGSQVSTYRSDGFQVHKAINNNAYILLDLLSINMFQC